MSKLSERLLSFQSAIDRLSEGVAEYSKGKGDLLRDGVIQRFEFTYELAWKTAKDYLEDSGIDGRNSPKSVMREAFAQRLIVEEENWLMMIRDRNSTTHIYDEDVAASVADRICGIYVLEFARLLERLKV